MLLFIDGLFKIGFHFNFFAAGAGCLSRCEAAGSMAGSWISPKIGAWIDALTITGWWFGTMEFDG
jgi:hypothetical protein